MNKADKSSSKKEVIALIKTLFLQAEKALKKDSKLADRYVRKARRAAQRVRMPIPSEYRKSFCKYCGKYWLQGKTVRVRLQKQKIVYFCFSCKRHTRQPYVREKKARKAK